jgi:two-component system sensor histidine kinase AtoS
LRSGDVTVPRSTSLRQRFLLIVLGGAVLPLALVGWWLTRSAVRSAEAQLRARLDSSLASITDGVQRRWVVRRGELLFLTDNEVIRRTLALPNRGASQADSQFMAQLFAAVSRATPSLKFVTGNGDVRWLLDRNVPGGLSMGPIGRPVLDSSGNTFLVRLPIRQSEGSDGHVVGALEAHVRLASVLAENYLQNIVGGAAFSVVDRATGATLTPVARDPDDPAWITVRTRLDDPSLDLALSAPSSAYIAPFERAARLGLLALAAVALLAVTLTTYLTGRVTRSLEQLVEATTAVAAGDLSRNVATSGHGEVERLALAFNSMTDSLRRTLHELSHREALAAVGEFAARLSHEVRNGMSAIRMDLQRIGERVPHDDKTEELTVRALQNVRRLDATVTAALRVARGAQVTRARLDLRHTLAAAAAAAEPTFAAAGAALHVDDDNGPLWIEGDAAALEQLFLNLLINAGQALSDGGGARVSFGTENGHVVIAITDSGVGMSRSQLQRIGEPFYSSKAGGTGLGLSIARKIAALHGGSVSVASDVGRGTTVTIALPCDATPQ